ncbi:MAG: AbrB/MazE/SpoVT family DNA-binding domain-containing protein [Ignavibacteriales bacterium]|nr:AbrB/MazE/SpoVT family DNA-binding domain-containing protein [Ignavibacteriales bacterium]
MDTSIVTTKGQVVIPSKLRRRFGIKNGTRIHFYEKEGEIRLIPLTHELVDSNIGFLETKGKLLKILAEEKKKEREL